MQEFIQNNPTVFIGVFAVVVVVIIIIRIAAAIAGGDLIVPAGQAVIDLQFIISGDSFGSRHTNVCEQQKVALNVARGKKYTMKYDLLENKYEWRLI